MDGQEIQPKCGNCMARVKKTHNYEYRRKVVILMYRIQYSKLDISAQSESSCTPIQTTNVPEISHTETGRRQNAEKYLPCNVEVKKAEKQSGTQDNNRCR
ncbi:hypothetical protein DINM_002555 [Dirofilaria immitis]|nr:hypothetical protein [Dirofilaria immitis]